MTAPAMFDGECFTVLGAGSGNRRAVACQDEAGDYKGGREYIWLCRLQFIPVAQYR